MTINNDSLPAYILDIKELAEYFSGKILDDISKHISETSAGIDDSLSIQGEESETIEESAGDIEEKPANEDGSIEFELVTFEDKKEKQKPSDNLIHEINAEFPEKLPELKSAMQAAINKEFKNLLEVSKGTSKSSEDRVNGLSLVGNDELELQIILTHAESTLLDTTQFELALLTIRFEEFTKTELNVTDIPAGPVAIAESFEKAIIKLDLDQDQKKIILIAILVEMKLRFPEFLRQANNLMIRAGILPILTADNERVKKKVDATRLLVEERKKDLDDNDGDGVTVSGDIARLLQNFELPAGYEHHGINLDDSFEKISDQELKAKLHAIIEAPKKQENNVYYDYNDDEASLAEQIVSQAELEKFGITDGNCNTVSILSMLFEQLLSNPSIPNAIKGLLSQLKVPLLKSAMSNEGFFEQGDNTAHNLFNEIAQTGLSWMPEENPDEDLLYKTMSAAVEKVNHDFDDDEIIFEDALEEIKAFKEKQGKRSVLVEDRIVQSESAQARLQSARNTALKHVQGKFIQLDIPQTLKDFFTDTWQQVLFFIFNKEGSTEGQEWLDAIEVENSIIANLHESEEDDIDICIDILNEKLIDSGLDNDEVEKISTRIKDILINSNINEADSTLADQVALHDAEESKVTVDNPLDERLEKLQVGTWLFKHEGEKTIKIKVAAHIKFNDTFVMVHRNGQKENIYTSEELIQHLDDQILQILDSGEIRFDTALESVIEEIRA